METAKIIADLKTKAMIEDIKARGRLDSLLAASGPADERTVVDEYVDLWGKEIGAALLDALSHALSEIEPTNEQVVGHLLAAAGRTRRVLVDPRCLNDEQKAKLKTSIEDWQKNIEGSVEDVVNDTFGNVTEGLEVQHTVWGVSPPEDIYESDVRGLSMKNFQEEAFEEPLSVSDVARINEDVNNHFEYWSGRAEYYQQLKDDNLLDPEELNIVNRKLEEAREFAGLSFVPSLSTGDELWFWTRERTRQVLEYDFRTKKKQEYIDRTRPVRERLEKLDRQNMKDFNMLDDVFRLGRYKRSYMFYERARHWRYRYQTGQTGGFEDIEFQGMGLSDLSPDVETFLSNKATAAQKALAEQRLRRFLSQNLPDPDVFMESRVNQLLRNKPFLKALGNPSIQATEIRRSNVGIIPLTGVKVREITDGAIRYAQLTIEETVRQVERAVCNGATFEEALQAQAARFERIGRDIGNYAMNRTSAEIANDKFFNQGSVKVWITSLVESRQWHIAVNGTRKAYWEKFVVGGERMDFPHDFANSTAKNTANCRCYLEHIARRNNTEVNIAMKARGAPSG